ARCRSTRDNCRHPPRWPRKLHPSDRTLRSISRMPDKAFPGASSPHNVVSSEFCSFRTAQKLASVGGPHDAHARVLLRKLGFLRATMTFEIDQGAYRLLLQLVLAQRLEINAIESALKNAGALADSQIQEIRLQASKAAEVWSRDGGIDLLGLIG